MSKTYINLKTGARVDVDDKPQPDSEWTDANMRKRGYGLADEPAAKAAVEAAEKRAAEAAAKAKDDDDKDGKDGKAKGGKGAK